MQIRVAMLAIDQLSIKASLTRISTQPVTIFIDHINLDVYEPPVTASRRPAASDPVDGAPRLPQPSRRPYGLSDRIADGIRVEVNEVRVRVRTLGKRKCPKVSMAFCTHCICLITSHMLSANLWGTEDRDHCTFPVLPCVDSQLAVVLGCVDVGGRWGSGRLPTAC